jgi:beta-lactamase class A
MAASSSDRSDLDRLDSAGLMATLDRLEASCSGRLGVSVLRLDTGEEVRRSATDRFQTASVIKVVVHAAVLRLGLDLSRRVQLGLNAGVGGSGVLQLFGDGIQPSVADLCTLMIAVSDNTATNLLIDLVGGVEAVNQSTRALGFDEIVLHRRLVHTPPTSPGAGPLATATPDALCRFMASVRAGTLIDAHASARIFTALSQQQDRAGVPRALVDLAEPGDIEPAWPHIANKTGWIPGCRADAGILTLPGGPELAYAVMVDDLADRTLTALSEGDELLGRVGAALTRRFWQAEGGVGVRPGWP